MNASSPLARLHISISRPCGNINDLYMKRSNKTSNNLFREVDECTFDYNGHQHDGYKDSGFEHSELDVYLENSIIEKVKKWLGVS